MRVHALNTYTLITMTGLKRVDTINYKNTNHPLLLDYSDPALHARNAHPSINPMRTHNRIRIVRVNFKYTFLIQYSVNLNENKRPPPLSHILTRSFSLFLSPLSLTHSLSFSLSLLRTTRVSMTIFNWKNENAVVADYC